MAFTMVSDSRSTTLAAPCSGSVFCLAKASTVPSCFTTAARMLVPPRSTPTNGLLFLAMTTPLDLWRFFFDQHPPQHFPDKVLGQLLAELDLPRHGIFGQPPPAHLHQLVFAGVGALAQHHVRLHPLERPARRLHAHYRHLFHVRVLVQHLLHVARVHLVVAGQYHLTLPGHNGKVAVVVHARQVRS